MKSIAWAMKAILCGVIAIGLATACSSDHSARVSQAVGTVTIPLRATVGVNTYRLEAVFAISGAQGTVTLATNGDERVLTAALQAGSYIAVLQSFTLSKDDGMGTFDVVRATVVSDRQAFTIFANSTTSISFQFETDGQVVSTGSGNLNVTFAVTETAGPCAPLGPGCPDGSWCAPPALTGEPIACIPAGSVPIGDACSSPLDCVAPATCHDFGDGPVCAALCSPSEFGTACTSGGNCIEADPSYGLCTPQGPCNPITVDPVARTVQSSRFFLDFSNRVADDPEEVDVLRWAGGPNLAQSFALDACTSGVVEYFGNSWVPPGPNAGDQVVVGSGSSGSWEQDGASILIHSTSSGCSQSTSVPVETRYSFREGLGADTIEVERQFGLGNTSLNRAFRPFMPRLTVAFDRVLHPDATGTSLRSEDVIACPYGCTLSDWDGSWFAYYASSGPLAGQGMVVLREPSTIPANLWIDNDAGITETNASSVLLVPPAGGFPAQITEKELLCFFDTDSWSASDQAALRLPAGCALDLECNAGGSQPSPCEPNPCQHGAACTNLPGPPADYQCACPPGINGKNCDVVFTDIEGAFGSTCGLRSDGRVACWGIPSPSDLAADPPVGTFQSIATAHTADQLCGLDAAGVAHCFGADYNNVKNPPNTPFQTVSISAGGACGVLPSGGIFCWNQLPYAIPGVGSFTALSMGTYHTCALRADQTLACWGQTGIPSIDFGQTIPPSGTFVEVSSGVYGSCALRTDSTVACWGAAGSGGEPLVAPSGTFSQIEYRSTYGCGIKTDGTLGCWAGGPFGTPLTLPSGTFRDVTTNWWNACAIRTDDSVTCFGYLADDSVIPTGQF